MSGKEDLTKEENTCQQCLNFNTKIMKSPILTGKENQLYGGDTRNIDILEKNSASISVLADQKHINKRKIFLIYVFCNDNQ